MSAQPQVSIIMCFLNEERFIEEAIQSVLQQAYTNWELLLIDDGSADKSTDIAQLYAQRYPGKIIYKDHEKHANRGTSISRNLALNIASGELITFLDGDDVLLPGMLSQLLSIMQQKQVPIIIEASKYWYSWDGSKQKDTIVPVGTTQDKLYLPGELMLRLYPLGKGMAPCICGILMEKSVLIKHGGFDESFKGMYDDQSLLVKLYLHESIYISSTCNNWYRQNEGSLVNSSSTSGSYFHDRKRFLEWLDVYLKSNGFNSFKLRFLLYKAWMPYRHPAQHFVVNRITGKIKSVFRRISA